MKTKIKMMKRIIALLLCLCMCFSNAEGLILFAAEADTAESAATGIDSEKTEGSSSGNNFALMAENAPMPIAEADESTMIEETPFDNTANATRVHLNWMNSRFGGVEKKNYIYVYAFAGEKICLGSSVYNAGNYRLDGTKDDTVNSTHKDDDSIDIVIRDLSDTPIAVDIKQNGEGHIGTVAKEDAAKNMTSPAGDATYKPYVYAVPETGVYTIEFRSYSGGATGSYNKTKAAELLAPSEVPGLVSAWDITVFNENNEKEPGRTYTNCLSLQTGDASGCSMKERYYVITADSYIYSMTFNGVKPYTYNFFSNNRGVIDNANGNIVYKSVKDIDNSNSFDRMGVSYSYPGTKDNDLAKSFPIFFEKPSDDLKGIMYEEAILPDPAVNLEFSGGEMYAGNGGYFSFDVKEATTATLRIEFTEGYKTVEISDVVMPYATNQFFWDGKDGAGTIITDGNDIKSYSVTTKAGEIHFPIFDAECAPEGITFTRISKIYDREGKRLDGSGTIYDATRSVVYYDDTAIYYGEKVTTTGNSEYDIKWRGAQTEDGFYTYVNSKNPPSTGKPNEYTYYNSYAKGAGLRIGDHSHTSNVIDFDADAGSQQKMIDYLDSKKNPVGVSSSSAESVGNNTVTDFAIANYWMFTAAKEFTSSKPINIKSAFPTGKKYCNLVGRVFYDEVVTNGKYNSKEDGDHLLSGVTLELYKKLSGTDILQSGKTYAVIDNQATGTMRIITDRNQAGTADIYELVRTGIIPALGTYTFTGVEYDETNGTTYLYHVVKPNNDYQLKSGTVKGVYERKDGANDASYGFQYSLYDYDTNAFGTEIQIITIGGSGVTPTKNGTITTIDVGYSFDTTPYSLRLKKEWSPVNLSDAPTSVVFEISCRFENGDVGVWDCRTLAKIDSWLDNQYYMPTVIDGKPVSDYYISAEYYISGDKVFRHKYDYDPKIGIYNSFIGTDEYFSISDYVSEHSGTPEDKYTMDTIPDFNGDGKIDGYDLSSIKDEEWQVALPAGTVPTDPDTEIVAPFNSVLDINRGTAVHEITVTNAKEPGTIEVLKYTEASGDTTNLSGAVFSIYKGNKEEVKSLVDAYSAAVAAYDSAPAAEKEALRVKMNAAYAELLAIQVDSASTRANGRYAFSGLDPDETYTVRERYAPSGYRVLQDYYQVNPSTGSSSSDELQFDPDTNYCLVKVANAPADGEFEIWKRITGRAWQDDIDNFTFDIDVSSISLDTNEYTILGSIIDTDSFKTSFNSSTDVTIGADAKYAEINGVLSADTKASASLLNDGTSGKTASFNNVNFPAAGTYTFTVQENKVADDPTLTTSPRRYTVTVGVVRALDEGVEADITKDNSHLTATISNITYQDIDVSEGSSESVIFSGNAPVFTNVYEVQDVDLKTKYIIEKDFTGRTDGWLESDQFEFIVDGVDEASQNALRNGNIVIEGDTGDELLPVDSSTGRAVSARHFYLNKDNTSFSIKDIKFKNVSFNATYEDENGDPLKEPITEPIIWKFTVKETQPEEAVSGVYQGIKYTSDVYTLEIKLENSAGSDGEIDGIIDRITMLLYKNDTEICNCVINQTVDSAGNEMVESQTHSGEHTMTFANEYKTQAATWQPTVKKTFMGRSWKSNDSFTFHMSVTPLDGSPADGYSISSRGDSAIVHSSEPHEATFGTITFKKPGTYNVIISETASQGEGIESVGDSSRTIKVKIEDDNKGLLILTFPDEDTDFNISTPIEFTNQYSDTERTVPFTIKKTLEGREWRDADTFTFKFLPDEDSQKAIEDKILVLPESMGKPDTSGYYTMTVKGTDTADANTRSKLFGDIKITSGAESTQKYGFKITEDTSGLHNTDTSDAELYLTMLVERERNHDTDLPTGNLTVSTAYSPTDYPDETDCEVIETGSEGIVVPFTNAAYVTGSFTVKKELEEREWKETDSFTVDVKVTSGNAESVMYDGKTLTDSIPLTFTEAKKEEKVDFRFNEAGEYTFSVKEQIPTGASDGYYNFIAYDEEEHTVTVTVEDSTTGQLEIKEIQVDGTSASDIESAVATITNRYIPTPITYIPQVKKEFTGDPIPTDGTKTFEFSISANAENPVGATLPGSVTTTVTGAGTATFGEITFEKAGTYNFTITEVEGSEKGYKYDPSEWTLTVIVEDNNGNLEVKSYTYKKTGAEATESSTDAAIFKNSYTVTPVDYQIEVTKILTGTPVPTGYSQEFQFELSESGSHAAGTVEMPADTTLTIDFADVPGTHSDASERKEKFEAIKFKQAGTYTFTVTETDGGKDGYTYSEETYTVTIEVVDNDSELEVEKVSYAVGTEVRTKIEFTNIYHPLPITYSPKVKKTIDGVTVGPHDFTFTLAAEDGNPLGAELPDEKELTINIPAGTDATESDTFDAITFSEAGEYRFTITENPTDTLFAHDNSIWVLTVVTEDAGGTLEIVSSTYEKKDTTESNEEAAEFKNRYTPKSTTYAPKAEKQFTGDPIPTAHWKTFEFTISADAANPDGATLPDPATATVTGAGTATFDEITFEKAGTYNFTIVETKGSDSGYEYDDSEWTLTVEVTDNAGVLEVTSHTYKKEAAAGEDTGENEDYAIFTNQYQVTPVSYTPKAEKILSGQTPVEDYEFTFELSPKEDYEDKVKDSGGALTAPITVTHDGPGKFDFPTLTFTQAGTYEFTIKEVTPDPKPTGYTFDEREWTLKVVVTDNESTLEISAEYEIDSAVAGEDETNSDAAYCRNVYVPNSTTYIPEIQKKLTGDPIPDDKKTFTFSIENAGVNDGAALPADTTTSVTGDAPETTAKFGDITFSKAGTYSFTITEAAGSDAGYKYDDSKWTLTVEVEDNDGNLEVTSNTYTKAETSETNTEAAIFENRYTVTPVDYQIGVMKVLTGTTVPDGYPQEFQFVLTDTNSDTAEKVEMPSNTTLTIDFADASGAYSDANERTKNFDAITFKQAGTYTFTVTEVDDKKNGYTYSGDAYTVTIKVVDKDSELQVDSVTYAVGADSKDKIVFTNNYHPLSTKYSPKVTKTIDGVTVGPHDFTFTLAAEDGNPDGAELPVATELTITTILGNNATASGTFDAITFSEAGTYQFTIIENPTGTLFAHDESIWVLTVVIEDAGGTLKVVSSTYEKKDTTESNTESANFKNEYTPENATYSAQVEKQISGDPTPEDDQKAFTFTIEEVEGNPVGVVLPTKATTTVKDKGTAAFDAITFKKAGTYNFTISENQETYAGYTFDKSTWNLEVVVVDYDGTLAVENHTYTKNGDSEAAGNLDKAVFVNTYTLKPTTYEAKAVKVLTGETPITDITYTFALASTEDYSDTIAKADGSPLAAEDTVTAEITGAGDVTFPALTFKQAGTYTFTIKEQKPDPVPEGYTYDERTWTLTVVVKDYDSQLEIADTDVTYEASSPDALDPSPNDGKAYFHNEYEPTPVDKNIVIVKEIEGDKTPDDKTFSFDITAAAGNKDGGADLEGKATVTITGEGQTSQKITFRKAGTYRFTVAETKGADKGYTYDGKQWTVTVEVSDQGGHLAVDSIAYRQDGAVSDSTDARAVFTNEYHVTPAAFTPDITKTLTIEHDDPAESETFTFILKASADNDDSGASLAPGEQKTITITLPDSSATSTGKQAVGEKNFDDITFTKAGTYKFQITEVNNNKPDSDTAGFTYDGHVWTIEVTVTDVDSELQVETKYTKWESTSAGVTSETAAKVDFENNYRANPVGYYPQVEKLLTGSRVTNSPETFNFRMEYLGVNGASEATSDDGVTLPENMTASVVGSGKTNFEQIKFTKEGVFRFRITETAGSTSGYTYDDSKWILTVMVTNVNGYLKETHSYQKEDSAGSGDDTDPDNAVFVNNYEVKTVSYAIPVQKILNGTVPEGYEQKFHFEFSLKNADPEDGVVLPTNTSLAIDYSDETARSKTFEEVTFKEAGTYTFEIREVNDGKDGYTYSGDVYTVEINVTDVDSQLTITLPTSVQYHLGSEKKDKAVFENTYHPLSVAYEPIVTKKIDGTPVNDHEFTFTLEPDSENPAIGCQMPKENELKLTVPAGEDPTASGGFQEIQFTEEGTYHFIIKETQQTEDSAYQYDDSEWTLTVEVTDIGGRLEEKASYSKAGEPAEGTETGTVADTAEFENIYTPQKVTFAPKAVKEIIGAEPSSDSTFSFTLSEQSGNPAGGAELPSPATASVIGEGTAEFGDITFAKAGTYHFTIQEVNGGVKGYEYDDAPWTLTVIVADTDAVLSVESVSYTRGDDSSTNRALFTNEYSVTPVTFTAEVEKQVTGDVPEGEDKNFYFAISTTADTDSVEMPADPRIQITGPGNASFEPITFKVKGEYTFEIREMNTEFTPENQDHGYGYDGTVWTLKVTVSDAGGALQVESATYQLKDGTTGTLALFGNTYTPDAVKYQPVVSDTITGAETPDEKAFTFTMTAASGNPAGAELPDPAAASTSVGTKEQQAHSAVGRFGDITFNKAGMYSFEIRQDNDGTPGYTYDGHIWTVTVEVADIDGVLTVKSVTYTRDDGITAVSAAFENAYAVTETSVVLNVTKQLVVDASSILPNTNEKFEFELSVTANPNNGAIVPDNKVITITPDSTHLQGTASYDAITFTKAGTYRFQITEKNHHLAGYTYSGRIWNVTVVVTDEDSVLTTDITYQDKRGNTSKDTAAFVNRFEADPVGYTPWARKVVEGAEMPENHEAEFTFAIEKIEGADTGVIMPDSRTASVTGVGRADFDEIVFDQAGTYKFRITEETGEAHGYDYDAASWILTVEVTNVDGKLKVDPVYEPETGTAESSTVEATFTNHYSVISTRLVPRVTKTVTGNPVPKGMEKNFAFSLKPTGLEPADGCTANKQPVTLDTVLSTNRTGDGKADFPAVTFTKAGTYTFEIWENVPTAVPTGYTYDTTVWTLTVEVVDDDHRLQAYATYQSPLVNESSSADFVNRYVPDAASFVPAVEKTIEGDYVGEKPFTFKIEPEGSTDGVIWPADYQDTVIINGENTGTFGELGFTKAGEYTFNITEVKGRTKGYSYDESVWTLTVTVTDTDGVLTASGVYEQTKNGIADETVTAPEKNADAAKFVNIYKTEEVRYAPVVSKKVTGDSRPPKPETFRFTIEAAADNPEGAAITDKDLAITTDSFAYEASGTIRSFEEIAFTKAGTYRFTIRETKETAAGYTYDGKTWTVEIEVEDRDSVLTVIRHTYTCEDGTSNDNRAVFTNEYTVKETQYTAKVSKTVEGNPPVDNTFNFYLRPYEDNPEGAVLNNAGELDTTVTGSGTSLFDAITFTKAGTYRFMIGEETGEAQGYDYAGDIWTLTVTVEDQDSQLVVVKTEYAHDGTTAEEAAFTNAYQAIPRTYVPHVHNIVMGHDRPKGQEFTFTITADDNYGDRVVMPADGGDTVHITDTGWAEFGGITFKEHGTYTFTITEEVPTELPTGYVYEQHREWTMTVEVTDTDSVLGLKVTYFCKTCQDQGKETGHPMNRREAIFIHNYVPFDTKYAPTVSKAVDGETPEDKTFTFAINSIDEYADEVQMPDVTTVQVTGSGDAEFDPVIFRKAGVYQFEIREKDDGLTGYYYDINVWILTVTVEDVDGELQVTGKDYVMAGSEDVSETAAFINVYRPLSVGYAPKLEKTVVGDTPEVPEVFTFYVTPDESCILDVIWPDDMMIDITGPGTGEFGEFRFTKPGVYTMRLEELIGTAEGYTYDESVWILTVTVTDADGQLEAEAVYTKENVRAGGEDHALFVNTYKKPEAPAEPEEPTVTENSGTQGTTTAPSQDADVVTEDSDVSDASKNQSAKTDDEMNLALWMLLAGISAAGAGVIYRRKKKKQ